MGAAPISATAPMARTSNGRHVPLFDDSLLSHVSGGQLTHRWLVAPRQQDTLSCLRDQEPADRRPPPNVGVLLSCSLGASGALATRGLSAYGNTLPLLHTQGRNLVASVSAHTRHL
jgi:hypothetical protein